MRFLSRCLLMAMPFSVLSPSSAVAGVVSVRVETVNGDAAANAELSLDCQDWSKILFADKAGRVKFSDVPEADCTLDAFEVDHFRQLQWRSEQQRFSVGEKRVRVQLRLSVAHRVLVDSSCCPEYDYSATLREELQWLGLPCQTWWPQDGLAQLPGAVINNAVAPCRDSLLSRADERMSTNLLEALLKTDMKQALLRKAIEGWADRNVEHRLAFLRACEVNGGEVSAALLALALKDDSEDVRAAAALLSSD